MAAWKRKGGLEKYHDKILDGLTSLGYERQFTEAIFEQIKGFSEYGFPEFHAASFALPCYSGHPWSVAPARQGVTRARRLRGAPPRSRP